MPKALSVSQLNNYIKGVFRDELLLHNIDIFGEITEFNVSGGNTYITVKEGDCILQCIKFGVHEPLPVGMKILLSGSVTFYEKGGRVSFSAKEIKPYGEGEQFLALKLLKDKLAKEGLFENRKPLPTRIASVAVITSASGAVIHDILKVLQSRIKIDVYVYNVRVQGEGADIEIAEAIDAVNELLSVDCIVVARGGGAFTDLNVFNSEIVARAVADSKIPIVSAVGHETDYTLCDLCAGTRAGTPSIAAELIASVNDTAYMRICSSVQSIARSVGDKLTGIERRLYRACHSISLSAESRMFGSYNALRRAKERLDDTIEARFDNLLSRLTENANALNANIDLFLSEKEKRYDKADKKLELLSPLKILSQGYARIKKTDEYVFNASDVAIGDGISVIMHDGALSANVTGKILGK